MSDTDPKRVTVLVNGRREEVRTEQDTALLYVLRNHLGLKGTRFGCGLGLCGTCLVLVDGQPAYSCDTSVRGSLSSGTGRFSCCLCCWPWPGGSCYE